MNKNANFNILQSEYCKLVSKCQQLENVIKESNALNCPRATGGAYDESSDECFAHKILAFVKGLYQCSEHSDVVVQLAGGRSVPAHRFVLLARSSVWPFSPSQESVDLSDMPHEIALIILEWVYTGEVKFCDQENFSSFTLASLCARHSRQLKLNDILLKSEAYLITLCDNDNCIRLFKLSNELALKRLQNFSITYLLSEWERLGEKDFEDLLACDLYTLITLKESVDTCALHLALALNRQDVIVYYCVENAKDILQKLNSKCCEQESLLNLALKDKKFAIADTLINQGADINFSNMANCQNLLHQAVLRKDIHAINFLINKECINVNSVENVNRNTALHSIMSIRSEEDEDFDSVSIVKNLLEVGGDVNLKNKLGLTALMLAVINSKVEIVRVLLDDEDAKKKNNVYVETKDDEGHTTLWHALQHSNLEIMQALSSMLISAKANPNAINTVFPGDKPLLHEVIEASKIEGAIFLLNNGANVELVDSSLKTPLHVACESGCFELAEILVSKYKVDVSKQTLTCAKSALHLAVESGQKSIVEMLLRCERVMDDAEHKVINAKDKAMLSPLIHALNLEHLEIAAILIEFGADLNNEVIEGEFILHYMISHQKFEIAKFLIDHGYDASKNSKLLNKASLEIAIELDSLEMVDFLCSSPGINLNMKFQDSQKDICPLWMALNTNYDIASLLVQFGCDTTFWHSDCNDETIEQTLLHHAIDINDEKRACFLIFSCCDIESPKRYIEERKEENDQQSPLHLACSWGLEEVVQALIEHKANVNCVDAENRSPLHIALINQQERIVSLLFSHPLLNLSIKDVHDMTPFSYAAKFKNFEATQAILHRDPSAAEQCDSCGRNFLHAAIKRKDVGSVLFLLGLNVNVNSVSQDANQLSPLQAAILSQNEEVVVRSLILAGADVNACNSTLETALHMSCDNPLFMRTLIENNANVSALDASSNNALHNSVKACNLDCINMLLEMTEIQYDAFNSQGLSPFHYIASSPDPVPILEAFLSHRKSLDINLCDANGNTILLYAYLGANLKLCKAIISLPGICLGTKNLNGVSIFTAKTATKQLLNRILDCLKHEPQRTDADDCEECSVKFGLTTRKHHCRHCGRTICAKCSEKSIPIHKFSVMKPTRVCDMCFVVLSLSVHV